MITVFHAAARRAGVLLLMLVLVPVAADAQDPPLPDSLPDAAVDTLTADSVPARPLVMFPAMPLGATVGFAGGEWVWDREALLREAPITLTDLLDRVPGVAGLRAGVFVQPEAASAFGGTAGRVEIEVDGFVLDPLAAASFDLSQIPLAQLREVRVQRRLGLLRIRLITEQPSTEQPYSRIEAGIGEPSGNMFRGLFLVPHVIVGPLGLAIERVDTDGPARREPADVFSGWAKWAWTDGDRGAQLEFMQTTLRRDEESPWLADRVRRDVILRARTGLMEGLHAEVYAGRSTLDETLRGTGTDTTDDLRLERAAVQAGVRAVLETPWALVSGALRYRDAEFLPSTEAVLNADLALGPVRATGEVGRADWRDAGTATYSSAHVEVGPLLGASAFAEITRGERGSTFVPQTSRPVAGDVRAPVGLSSRDGWRAGISARLGDRASGSVAMISLDQDMARPFGLPFDSSGVLSPVEAASGFEAHGRLVLFRDVLALESSITDWTESAGWVYLPARSWRTALELHTLPLPSGNLEILGRLEASHRSGMLAYMPHVEGESSQLGALAPYTVANGYLQIRVIDVRAFIRWEDLLGTQPEVLPGRVLRGPRIFYGVKWTLWN